MLNTTHVDYFPAEGETPTGYIIAVLLLLPALMWSGFIALACWLFGWSWWWVLAAFVLGIVGAWFALSLAAAAGNADRRLGIE